jgi:hypothetical protein
MTFGSTWRKHPFVEGRCYLARESFHGHTDSDFVAGVLYEFQHVGYSHYDSSTVFTFRAKGKANKTYWWWRDDESEELCSQRFQESA